MSRPPAAAYLEEILAGVRADLEGLDPGTVREWEARAAAMPPARDMAAALVRPGEVAVIAEFKRASPSRGMLGEGADPVAVARAYREGGAAALSVLTQPRGFLGSPADLVRVRESVDLPVLRKDFILDERQVVESRALGADAVLLIVAAVGRRLGELLSAVSAWGMQALVEVHDARELEAALEAGARLVGINNRDLRTFRVDTGTAVRLARLLPAGTVGVAESGVDGVEAVQEVARAGLHAVLVGEYLMRQPDPAAAVAALRAAGTGRVG